MLALALRAAQAYGAKTLWKARPGSCSQQSRRTLSGPGVRQCTRGLRNVVRTASGPRIRWETGPSAERTDDRAVSCPLIWYLRSIHARPNLQEAWRPRAKRFDAHRIGGLRDQRHPASTNDTLADWLDNQGCAAPHSACCGPPTRNHDDVYDREEEEGHDHRIGSEWEAGAGSRIEWS
jgi:hypothetical protein